MRYLGVMLAAVAILGTPVRADEWEVVFEDKFAGEMDEQWAWLREDPEAWRLVADGLEIRLQPGFARTVRNALLRPAPDRSQADYAIDVTVTNHTVPTQQWEQAGITWYRNGEPIFKLVKELLDGQLLIIPGRPAMEAPTVQLRLIVTQDSWTAQFRPNAEGEFLTADQGKLPPPGEEQVSLQGYHGPPDAAHWVRFHNFRISRRRTP